MQFSSRFTIAVHILLAVNEFDGQCKTTSFFLGNSVNVNPVIIRKTLGQLKDAGLVTVEAGVGGASLAKDPSRWRKIRKRSHCGIFSARWKIRRKNCFTFMKIPIPIARWERISTRSWTAGCGSSNGTCRRIWMT